MFEFLFINMEKKTKTKKNNLKQTANLKVACKVSFKKKKKLSYPYGQQMPSDCHSFPCSSDVVVLRCSSNPFSLCFSLPPSSLVPLLLHC